MGYFDTLIFYHRGFRDERRRSSITFLASLYVFFVGTVGINGVSVCPCTELVEYFRAQMNKDPGMASAVAAIRTLLEFLKRDKGVFLSFNGVYSWKKKIDFIGPFRRNYPGSEREPDVGDSLPDRSGLLRGRVLRRRALPPLHQPHITGASGSWSRRLRS